LKTVAKILLALLLTVISANVASAADVTFRRVKVPAPRGRQVNAELIFSDTDKAVEVHPAKGEPVSIPYAQIDKCSYEYTKRHRVNGTTIATAPIGIGALVMLTKYKSHWLEIEYHDQEFPHTYVVRMAKRDYVHILDAVKTHVGIDAEILGNADKRKK
jgi:hypothetical protein